MVYNNNDDFRYQLNKPLMMAGDDDDDELFNDDAPSDAGDEKGKENMVEASASERDSNGITRNAAGFGVLALLGIVPLSLLILYMTGGLGLSSSSMLFMIVFGIGLLLSIWTFMHYRKGVNSFTRFDVHSFFKWPEIITIAIVLVSVSFYNLANLHSGDALRLSAESTINATAKKTPYPIYAPQPPSVNNFEENEVLYQGSEYTNVSGKQIKKTVAPAVTTHKSVSAPVNVSKPVAHVDNNTSVKHEETSKTKNTEAVENKNDTKTTDVKTDAKNVKTTSVKAHEDEEGTSTSKGAKVDNAIGEVIKDTNSNLTNMLSGKAAKSGVPSEIETTGIVSSLFLGGILCAALGYAFSLALAGGILGLFRKFNHPFSAKTKEIINEETGEITLETESQEGSAKIIDLIVRFFVGFNIGGTVGFLLGLVITLPLYFLFWDKAQSEPVLSSFLMTLGVAKNPDLAYGAGVAVAGLIVPMVMMVVGKSSPAGMSLSEEEVRQVYSIPVTINKVTDVATIPEPALVSFDLDDSRERDGVLVDDFSDDDHDSITNELIEEFGLDAEKTFGIKMNLPAKTSGNGNGNGNGHHEISDYEKQKVAEILENSLGELGNVTVQVSAELGKATILLTDWLNLSEGMLIELDKPASQEIDILINDVCKGKGKLAVVDNHLSVKVSKANFSHSAN